MEAGQRKWPLFKALRVPRGACGPRPRREDHAQRRQILDRRSVPGDWRRDVQLRQRGLESRLYARHQVSAEWLLSPQLSPGTASSRAVWLPGSSRCWLLTLVFMACVSSKVLETHHMVTLLPGRWTLHPSTAGVPSLQDLSWSRCDNRRKKVPSKCNALESSWNCLLPRWGENLSSTKTVRGAEKVRDCCSVAFIQSCHKHLLSARCVPGAGMNTGDTEGRKQATAVFSWWPGKPSPSSVLSR